jgi:hypothetical protein
MANSYDVIQFTNGGTFCFFIFIFEKKWTREQNTAAHQSWESQ